MILDLVKKDFPSDITSRSSLKDSEKGVYPDTVESKGDSSDEVVFSAKDDSGQLINCPKDGIESLNADELSQIEIVDQDQDGGNNIFFIYKNGPGPPQYFDWKRGESIGQGGYGEVKRFKLTDNKYVAIKKYPTWKFKDNDNIVITDNTEPLSPRYNEGKILEKIDKKCVSSEPPGCIRICDIVPAHYIKSSDGDDYVFSINTKHFADEKFMDYSFIAMEAMTGSLRKYAAGQKNILDEDTDVSELLPLDKIFVNVTKIILKVAKILQCLSDKGYYYPDLKSDNVLYKCEGGNIIIKMGDIGSLTERENLINGDYIRTYHDPNDSQGASFTERDTPRGEPWGGNPNYHHVYLLGYLYIHILTKILGINFGDNDGNLQNYTVAQFYKPDDGQIRKDINNFINEIQRYCKSSDEKSCIGERFSVLIKDVLHKTIVSQLELRYKNENELIGVLNRFINKTNEDKEGE
jgi:serine/threonine protein kinase